MRIQQEQTFGTLDTKIDAMMARRTQAIMDSLDGLLCNRSGSKNGESNSGEPSREPRVNLNEQPNRRRTYGSTRGRGSSSSVTGDNRTRGSNIRGSSTGNKPTSNERPTQDTHATGRCDSRNRSHANQGRKNPSNSDRRENPEPLSGGNDTQAGHSRDATSMATAFEPLWKHSYRGYLEPMNVEDLSSERQECTALTSNLDATALNCVMANEQHQWDTTEKIFEILLNRFDSGVQGHQQ